MNQNTIVTVASPLTDPVRREETRTLIAIWKVGPVLHGQWQQQTEMIVSHWRHHNSFQCALRAVRRDVNRPVRPFHDWKPGDPHTVRFHQCPTAHFNSEGLMNAYVSALAEVRTRFQAGDQQVRAFFAAMPDADLLTT